MQGSDAPASLVDEGSSQGSLALEDWQPQNRVHLEDLPRLASIQTPRSLPGLQAPSQSHCTLCGCILTGMDPYSQGMIHNSLAEGYYLDGVVLVILDWVLL